MAILNGFAALCFCGVFSYKNAKQSRLLCAVSSHKSLPHQRTAHRFAMKAPNPFRPGESLISFPHQQVLRCVFCGKIFGKFSVLVICHVLRNLQDWPTRCAVNANIDSGDPGNQYCMTIQASSYPHIVYWLRASGVWNYPIGWAWNATRSHRVYWAQVRLPRTENFKKSVFPLH